MNQLKVCTSGAVTTTLYALVLMVSCWSCQVGTPTGEEEDQFSRHVRTTEALAPEEERLALKVPPGFEVQLFASEPDIGKPLNMAFDDRGRMWLTQSYEYPFADTSGMPRDQISILEDTDGDGTADKIEVFADSLNIPIGIVCMDNGVIAYSIPHIYHLLDHDGDDQVDERKVLYSGFQYNDTHGMINNLIRSWDGWIHAGHGFSNTSTVAGSDGDTIVMFSGNTFRIREDGSRVEFTTTGRVNPFGYAYDELGYTYSVDCHTSPIYQLVRGADYPHFGKQPTGIGFGPAIMDHDYGATALAGLEYFLANGFPTEYQESFYYGDVVKCRVYRASIDMHGTTPEVTQEDDFIVSEDPWFRPVDVKMGPDGALYIADFYNSIIGHYEVPLDHPGRDRQRGRIWRVVYTGDEPHESEVRTDWSEADLDELIANLDDDRLPLRMSLADQIVDRFGEEALDEVQAMMIAEPQNMRKYVQGMWIRYRLNDAEESMLQAGLTHSNDTVKVHALRIMFEIEELSPALLDQTLAYLENPNPHVVRQAVMVLAKYPSTEYLFPLINLRYEVPEDDTHLFYSIRQAIRDQLRDPSVLDYALRQEWTEEEHRALSDVVVGVDQPQAASFIIQALVRYDLAGDTLTTAVKHAARYATPGVREELIDAARSEVNNTEQSYQTYLAISEGVEEAGVEMPESGEEWALDLASRFLVLDRRESVKWQVVPDPFRRYNGNSWRLLSFVFPEDADSTQFIASGPLGFSGNGISDLRSPDFNMPASLEFKLIGRKRPPGEDRTATPPQNKVELRLSANDSLIKEVYVTDMDTREEVQWSGGNEEGELVYLNVVDKSSLNAEYVGIGDINLTTLELPSESPDLVARKQIFACQVARDFGAVDMEAVLVQLLRAEKEDVLARAAAAEALIGLESKPGLALVAGILENEPERSILRDHILTALSEYPSPENRALLRRFISGSAYDFQEEAVLNLMSSGEGLDFVLDMAGAVDIPPRILLEPTIIEAMELTASSSQMDAYTEIVADIRPPSEEIQELIDERLSAYNPLDHSIERGQEVAIQFCSTCHQIDGQGGNIGPQLDGIGNWGASALTEKILDPNRNISQAFVTYTVRMNDGEIHAGLLRREEGALMVLANAAGEEFSLPKSDIAEATVSPYTLMPDNFGQVIPEEDFDALLAYLLNEK